MSDAIQIRRASPDEIDELVSIDTDACTLYVEAGLDAVIGPEHPYSLAERAGWTRCAREGNAFVAGVARESPVGLLVMDRIEGAAYLEQLSIRRIAMRQGLGRRLLHRAIEWAGHDPLWLTTYAHIPWNRPFYERHGFVVVPEPQCPPGMVRILAEQREALPAPDERIVMRRVA